MIKEHKPIDKIIPIGDLHFGFKSNSHEWLNIMKQFFYILFIPFLEQIKERQKDGEHIVVLFEGDINDNKQLINNLIQNEQITIFEEIAKIFPVYVYIGNHDTPFKDKVDIGSDNKENKRFVNSCRSLGLIENVQVYDEPHILECNNGEKILLLPYQSNPDKELETINHYLDLHEKDGLYGFGHTEISGFHYEGIPVDESKHNPISAFKRFKKFYSGHIHKKQEIDNIMFTGTPYQTRKNEIKNEVGFHLIDFNEGKEYWIENKISPKHKQLSLFKLMDMKLSEANKFVENNFVDVVAPSSLIYKVNFSEVTNVLSGYREIDHRTVSEKTTLDLEALMGEGGLDNFEKIDVESKLPEYIDQLTTVKIGKNYVDITDMVRDKLKEAILKLHKAADSKVGDEELELG